jgi:hypothetical protein
MRGHNGVRITHPQQLVGECKSCGAVVSLDPWRKTDRRYNVAERLFDDD